MFHKYVHQQIVSFVMKLYFVVVILCFRAYLPANQGAVQPVRTFYHLLLSSMIYIDLLKLEKFPNFNFIKTWLPYSEIARPEHISNLPLLFFSVVKYFDLSLKLRFCFIGWVRVQSGLCSLGVFLF